MMSKTRDMRGAAFALGHLLAAVGCYGLGGWAALFVFEGAMLITGALWLP